MRTAGLIVMLTLTWLIPALLHNILAVYAPNAPHFFVCIYLWYILFTDVVSISRA